MKLLLITYQRPEQKFKSIEVSEIAKRLGFASISV